MTVASCLLLEALLKTEDDAVLRDLRDIIELGT